MIFHTTPPAAREKRKISQVMHRLRTPITTNCQDGGMTSIMAYWTHGRKTQNTVHQVSGGNHVAALVVVRPVLKEGVQRHQEQGGGDAGRHQQGVEDG